LAYDPVFINDAAPSLLNSFCGVGNPFTLGNINPGNNVLDIGSGAGFDLYVAKRLAGESGKVCGIDLTQEMVDKLLIQNQEPVQNKAKSIIDLQEIEHTIVSNPFIESASVYLTIDGLLKARVKQRTPIAPVDSGGEMYYLDKEGVRVPLSNHYSARVLLVTGQFEAEDDQEIKSFVQRILADDFLKKEIIGLHKTQKNEWVLDTRIGNQKIEFGSLERISVKFKKLKAFYNTTFEDQTINKYRTINLK